MQKKLLIFGIMLTLLVSCGKGKEETKTDTAPTTEVNTEEKTSENAQMAK